MDGWIDRYTGPKCFRKQQAAVVVVVASRMNADQTKHMSATCFSDMENHFKSEVETCMSERNLLREPPVVVVVVVANRDKVVTPKTDRISRLILFLWIRH